MSAVLTLDRRKAPLALTVAIPVFLCAFAVDLLSKEWAISHAGLLIYNDVPSRLAFRVPMALAAIAVASVLTRVAARHGLGRQWGVWVGCALLVSGTLANGLSSLLWSQGVPDFIGMFGGWVWNLADFEIAVGLGGGLLSVVVSALVVYARERIAHTRAGDHRPDRV